MPTYGLNQEPQLQTYARTFNAPQNAYPGMPNAGGNGGYTATGFNGSPALNGGYQGMGTDDLRQQYESAFGPGAAFQDPGFNMTNQGYDEQAFLHLQNRLMEDPSQQYLMNAANQQLGPSAGENYMNQNLGTLDGPGMGEQYWNQVQGQFMSPFAGEQYARQATQNFAAQGPASSFYNTAMGQYGDMTGYQGPGNTQGQYNTSAGALANGTRGEAGLGSIASGYAQNGTYSGANNALGQYQQNAASGPMAAQSFYDSVSGQYGNLGQYNGPNLSSGQYAQTQQAFGDLPIANFDPYYDRAIQLGTQDYNRQAAGRGVYGSSESLSGVGNIIADLNAERANRSFDAEMQRAVEQRNRQALLGQQAQMGDQSSLAAFGANLQGLSTFGNLANQAGNQTLQQQTMLGNQARSADQSGLDAFNANVNSASTYANINNMLGNQELGRHELLGNMANAADSQALGAQNSRVNAMSAFGNIAQAADSSETNRYNATTGAMAEADRNQLARINSGADMAFRGDDSRRADYDSSMNQARNAANTGMDRARLGADIANTASQNDLARLNATMGAAGQAEGSRQNRVQSYQDAVSSMSRDMQNTISQGLQDFINSGQGDWENWAQANLVPAMQAAGMDEKQIDQMLKAGEAFVKSRNPG